MEKDTGVPDSGDKALPCLLEDGPAPEDDFGSHKRIAEGMASLIQNQEGGHVIGLRGPFGSGKSTTVAELRKQLPKQNWSLVTFDAWTHRGDDLMRAFLASLIEQLSEEIGKADAERHRERIINQEEVQYTTSQSTVNIWGQLLVAIGIVATAITAGLRATEAFGADAFGLSIASSWLLWFGWLPWIAFWLILAIGFFGPWPVPPDNKGEIRSPIRKLWFPSFLIKWYQRGCFSLRFFQEGERVRTTIKNSGAANSITFQGEFAKIVELAISNSKTKRRIIVVLDNMDRLDEEDQLAAWSTVEAFVDAKFSFKTRVWFVLPLSYIDEHENDGCLAIRSAKLRENLADKMFLTEFRVPDLVLTDWVAYVAKLCQRILRNATDDIQESVARVIVSWERQSASRPRPRELRAVVNQIGGLYHQWQSEIPLEVIALYIVKIQDVESKGEALSDEAIIADFADVPGRKSIRRENISQELAMIHFSAPREKALQILVLAPFSEAMVNGQPLSAEGLAIPQVETLIDHVVREILSKETPGSTILRIAACLNLARYEGTSILNQTWILLVDRFTIAEEPWQLSDDGVLEQGAEELVKHYPNRETFDKAFARQVGVTLVQALEKEETEEQHD